jgi:hypothetical protein
MLKRLGLPASAVAQHGVKRRDHPAYDGDKDDLGLLAGSGDAANMWGIPFRQERTRYEYCLWDPEQSFRGEGPTSPELVKCYVTNSLIFASSWRGLKGFAT